jgi:predicted nucleic acid-binding protein
MTLAELECWPLERVWAELGRHMAHYTVLPVNRELCRGWAEISFNAKKQGIPIQAADAWIAASALYCQVPLITNNGKDYSTVRGLTVLTA